MLLESKKLRKTLIYSIFLAFVIPIAIVIFGVAMNKLSSVTVIASLFFALAMLGAVLFFIIYGIYDLLDYFSKLARKKKIRP